VYLPSASLHGDHIHNFSFFQNLKWVSYPTWSALLVLLGYYYHSIKTLDTDSIDEEYLSIIQVGINILLLISHQSI